METASPVLFQWIPNDDLLLKNAVEAGASLEALAKGAVQFSRRFSLNELRDRWHSLLYDPGISAQASAHMFELEISGVNPASKLNRSESNLKGSKEISQKRKSESLHRKYHTMRKKYRRDIFSNTDLVIFEPNPQFDGHAGGFQKQAALDGNPLGQISMLRDNISDLLELQEEDLDFLRHAFPETVSDIAVTSGTTNFCQPECLNSFEINHENGRMGGYGYGENVSSTLPQGGNKVLEGNVRNIESHIISENNMLIEDPDKSSVGFVDKHIFDASGSDGFASFQTDVFAPGQPPLRNWRAVQDVSVATVPDSGIGDTAHVAEGMFHDIESKENSSSVYIGEFADPHSLLNLPVEDELLVDADDAVDKSFIGKVEPGSVKVSEISSMPLSSAHPAVFEVVAPTFHCDQQINSYPEINVPMKSYSDSEFPEPSVDKICCVLNTEDTEVPCNDDIFLLIHPSTSFCGSALQSNIITYADSSSVAHDRGNEQVANLPANTKDSTKTFGWPQKIRMQGLSESHAVHSLVGRSVKPELHDSKPQTPLPGFANKSMRDPIKGKSLYTFPKVSGNRLVENDVSGVSVRVGSCSKTVSEAIQSTGASPGRIAPESVDALSVSDQEGSPAEDDVPYFSDVEAMILNMDLDPCDQHSQVIRQVPSYQYDETKRTIIRLEQCARSYLHRAMTSQGALAILYGRHLTHYIRKPEVLLGRSTDDFDVDIDLRREGRANKVSRRQAIIKMNEDASFSIKVLGKSSVSVNGMSIASGQSLTLCSGCLIEITGMSFVFDINERYVKQHSGNFVNKNKGKRG